MDPNVDDRVRFNDHLHNHREKLAGKFGAVTEVLPNDCGQGNVILKIRLDDGTFAVGVRPNLVDVID